MVGNKKIILVAANYPYGGASANLLRYFTFCLRDGGHHIEVILPTGGFYGKKIDQQDKRKGNIGGITYRRLGFVHHPKNKLGKLLDNLLGLLLPFPYLLLKTLKKEVDVIVVYNTSFLNTSLYVVIKKILRKKLIIILPEFYEKPKLDFPSLPLLKWYNFYFGIKYCVRFADKFIVLSYYLKRYVESRLKHPKNILILPNLTDPTKFSSPETVCFKQNCTTIGYVGTPTRKDGILDLIKSFILINTVYPNTHLLVIGDITNGNTVIPKLKEYARAQGANSGSITFKGLTAYDDIPKLLASCQIYALTRPKGIFAEAGFPTKLGEYFSCKNPVVLTTVGDMKNYFSDKKEVVFAEPENIQSIVNAFEYLLKNPEKGKEIGLNGYKWMEERLNYKNQVQILFDFFDN